MTDYYVQVDGVYRLATPEEAADISAREAEAAAPRQVLLAQLAATDAEYQPRWHEDARLGQPIHPTEQAWLDRRAALRAQLAALEGA